MSQKPVRSAAERGLFVAAAALIVSSFLIMGLFARSVKEADDDQFWEFTAMFSEIYREVRERYVEEVDSKKLFEGALQGMFLTLDPHSQYMDPDNYSQLEKDTEGAFSGVGIHIQIRDGVLTVIAPIPGSPAAKAGVMPWDRIIEIDGKETKGITVMEAVKKLTGPAGTTVKIGVYREGEPEVLHFELVRGNIRIESVYHKMLDNNIGYIRIAKFSDNTTRDLRKAIEDCQQKGAKGLIVDLRFNSGGLLKEAIETSNLFLPRGKLIVSTQGRIKSQNQELRAENDPVTDLPLVVLINRASASASEIFAGAIKDHQRGIVLGVKGQRTFGKGSVQTIEELTHSFEKDENGNYRPAAIRLTTARYLTPAGVKIDKVGVTPDIAVELPKGNEMDLLRGHLFGEPVTEEKDVVTTVSRFRWDNQTTGTTETVSSEEPGDEEEGDNPASAIKSKDKDTTAPEPKKIIPLDRALFPDAEVEGAPRKEEVKKTDKDKFIDYQLEVAKRLLLDKIERNLDFYHVDSGMPKVTGPARNETVAQASEKK
ncbi:MAG: S41 family peptidase [Candidatus Sumerlaeaceae bacterium]|nr:S41 family peptidase [Candidatus Sumerlaeaceae bacterium]